MFSLKSLLKPAIASLALLAAPMAAQAVTIDIDDLSNGVGVDASASGATTAIFSGMAGTFSVNIASATITTLPTEHILNATSIQTAGVGTLVITATETGLSDSGSSVVSLVGSGSVTDIGSTVTVEHFIDTGDGSGYQTIASLGFVGLGSDQDSAVVAAFGGTFDLQTIITIVNTSGDQTSNVNATLTAAVPLPAGGLLLISALAGAAALRRRKKAA